MSFDLPYSLTVDGTEYKINTDFRDALDAIAVFNADDLSPLGKMLSVADIIYGEDNHPPDLAEAVRQAVWFIDGGEVTHAPQPKTMDYKQDAPLLFSAVNRVAGYEVRNPATETHWWTFIGYCREIDPDSPISHIVGIRSKLARGEKLTESERKYYSCNRDIIDFKNGGFDDILQALRGE